MQMKPLVIICWLGLLVEASLCDVGTRVNAMWVPGIYRPATVLRVSYYTGGASFNVRWDHDLSLCSDLSSSGESARFSALSGRLCERGGSLLKLSDGSGRTCADDPHASQTRGQSWGSWGNVADGIALQVSGDMTTSGIPGTPFLVIGIFFGVVGFGWLVGQALCGSSFYNSSDEESAYEEYATKKYHRDSFSMEQGPKYPNRKDSINNFPGGSRFSVAPRQSVKDSRRVAPAPISVPGSPAERIVAGITLVTSPFGHSLTFKEPDQPARKVDSNATRRAKQEAAKRRGQLLEMCLPPDLPGIEKAGRSNAVLASGESRDSLGPVLEWASSRDDVV